MLNSELIARPRPAPCHSLTASVIGYEFVGLYRSGRGRPCLKRETVSDPVIFRYFHIARILPRVLIPRRRGGNFGSDKRSETMFEPESSLQQEEVMRTAHHPSAPVRLVCAVTLAVASFAASAEEFDCVGTVGAVAVDNLRVPDDATCRLNRTRVKGTIKVESNATLIARRIVVIGNVQAENANKVRVLKRSRVGGSVQVKQGGAAAVTDSEVDGDVQFDQNWGRLTVARSEVGGSVQIVENYGGAVVRRNVIDGNLQCKQNAPAPTGGGNVVGGNKEDQCASF